MAHPVEPYLAEALDVLVRKQGDPVEEDYVRLPDL